MTSSLDMSMEWGRDLPIAFPADTEESFVSLAEPYSWPSDVAVAATAPAEEDLAPLTSVPRPLADTEEVGQVSGLERAWNGVRHNKLAIAAGAITLASMAVSPIGEVVKDAGPAMVAAEVAWMGGAAMMLTSIGRKVWNPLKIRSRFKEIPEVAADSTLFKAGLAVNTAAAVAEFVIPAIAVTTKMPVEAWGALSFSTLDLFATVALRRMIWRGLHKSSEA